MHALAVVLAILVGVAQTVVSGLILTSSGGITNPIMLALSGLPTMLPSRVLLLPCRW